MIVVPVRDESENVRPLFKRFVTAILRISQESRKVLQIEVSLWPRKHS